MSDLPTSVLGRTGATVTKLAYGAMELRGRSPAAAGAMSRADQAKAILNARARCRHQPDRHLARLRRLRGADRRVHLRPPRRSSSWPASAAARSTRRRASGRRTSSPAPMSAPGSSRACRRMRTDHLDLVQFHVSPSRAELEANDSVAELVELQRRGQDPLHRHVRHAAEPDRPYRHGRLRRLPDPLLGPRARARGAHPRCRQGRRGHDHPRRRRARHARSPGRDAASACRNSFRQAYAKRRDLWDEAGLDDVLDGMSRMEFMLRFTLSHPDMTPPSSAPPTLSTSPTTSPPPRRGRCRPISTPRPSGDWTRPPRPRPPPDTLRSGRPSGGR